MFLRLSVLFCLALSLCACGGSGNTSSNQNANGSHAVVVTRVSPGNLSSATSPVNFDFKASSQTPIKGWTVTVDSKQVYQTGAISEMQTSLAIAAGTHQVGVNAWNSNGTIGSSNFALTVVSGSPTPTPTPSPTPTPNPLPTPTPTPSPTPTPTPMPTPTPTPTPSPSPTPTPGTNDFFVSPSGSDSNNGSASAPWATIQHAANSVGPGDTVNVADGTYNECNISIGANGTSSSPITFQSINRWGAKIVSPLGCTSDITVDGSWIVLKQLDISGGGTPGPGEDGGATGIFLARGTNHTVFNNRIHNIGNIFSTTTNGMVGIFVQTAHDVLDSNILFMIGRTSGDAGGRVCCSNDHSMYIDGALGATATTIQNNLTYQDIGGWAIQVFPGSMNNMLVINNTLDMTGAGGNGANPPIGCILQGTNMSNSRFANNLCINPVGGVMFHTGCCGDSASNVLIDHNLTTASSMVETNNTYTIDSSNTFNANANSIFVSLSGNDYNLASGSPAIGSGSSNGAPPSDIVGTARPQSGRFDAGAYEFTH